MYIVIQNIDLKSTNVVHKWSEEPKLNNLNSLNKS